MKNASKIIRLIGIIFEAFFFVTTAGFEPARPCEHQPLKLASLPFLHVA